MRNVELIVPSPALPGRLDLFVTVNLHGVSRRRVKTLIDAEAIRVNGRVERRGGRSLKTGDVIGISYRPSQLAVPAPLKRDAMLDAGDGWWAFRKPAGVPSHRSHEDGVGVVELARNLLGGAKDVHAAHRLDRETSGVLLLAAGETRSGLAKAFESRQVSKRYLAIVSPAPPASVPIGGEGTLDDVDGDGRPMHCAYALLRRSPDGRRAELAVSPREGRTHQIRIQLAKAGWPIVGDLVHGRPLPGGAPRMALHCLQLCWHDHAVACPVPPVWDALLVPPPAPSPRTAKPAKPIRRTEGRATPTDAASAKARPGQKRKQLVVSKATARVMSGGHPWVIPDRDTGPLGKLRTGEVIDLVDPSRRFVAMAIADPKARICARLVSKRRLDRLDDSGWRGRAERAIGRRKALLDDPTTNAIRLIHGQADGLPGLWVDLMGECLVATRLAACVKGFTAPVYSLLSEQFPGFPLYEKDHLSDLRAAEGAGGDTLRGRWIHPPESDHPAARGTWHILERGARYEVYPTEGLTTGFYPDQRKNRERLDAKVAGRGGLVAANLFAHTGAFSVSLALAGVTCVHTVDLSPKYLDGYKRNLALNDLSEDDHPAVAADSMVWLASAPPLDLVILDPPSFAKKRKKGGRGWNAQRDYASMVEAAASVLEPNGMLLCCHNLRGAKKGWLRGQIERGLKAAGRKLEGCEPAGPSPDYPTLRGFPEGHTFRGLLVTVR